jgi:hypothetical protein
MARRILCLSSLWFLAPTLLCAEPADQVQFNRDVRPILSNHCYSCHGPDKGTREADLRLDERESALTERNGVTAIVPGKPDSSELLRRVSSEDEDECMPPVDSGKKLSSEEVDIIRRWIAQGANWQPHWSFIPPSQPVVPEISTTNFKIQNSVDAFILARLQEVGLNPSPEADRRTLMRRLSFDLTGLPPSAEEVAAFVADTDPNAYEKVVDRLLASPHYGERMAIYWLDLVRFADTVGYHGDQTTAISPYRDYVINSFNANLPFNQFTIEQLAGDLLPNPTDWQKVASGFNRLNMTTEEGGAQAKEYLAKYMSDRVRAVSTVWMGATMGCCECHDHKFDPYTAKDFYRFGAFFADLKEVGVYGGAGKRPPEILLGEAADVAAYKRLSEEQPAQQKEVATLEKENPNSEALAAAQQKLKQIETGLTEVNKRVRTALVSEAVAPREIRVLARGNWMDEAGEVVQPGVPHFMKQPDVGDRRLSRLDLAEWLVAPEHPQTARVFMNRLWKMYFGVGISRVLDDMGAQGEWPEHPALLDYLATEFAGSHWNVKQMVKLLVMSSTYRQSSLVSPEVQHRDPLNRLVAHQSQWRIEAEMVRDGALAVSGLLVRTVGGPSVKPYQPAGYYAFLNFPKRDYDADQGENQYRRGVYMHWQRTFLHPQLLAFDAPTREECTAQRPISNTPKAALTLLNDPTFVEAARVLAEKTMRYGGANLDERLSWAYRQSLQRQPEPREAESLSKLHAEHLQHFTTNPSAAGELVRIGQFAPPEDLPLPELAAWTSVARVLLNLGESITRE